METRQQEPRSTEARPLLAHDANGLDGAGAGLRPLRRSRPLARGLGEEYERSENDDPSPLWGLSGDNTPGGRRVAVSFT